MKYIQLSGFALLLCVSLLATVSVRGEAPGLEIALRPYKASVLLGEPVVLLVAMTNSGPERLELPGQGGASVFVSSSNSEYKRWDSGFRSTGSDGICYDVAPLSLGPGKATEEWFTTVFYEANNGLVFSTTGTYSFVAEARVFRKSAPPENVRSKPVHVAVTSPQGEDLKVWEELQKVKEYGMFIQAARGTNDQSLAVLSELIERHPKSAYAPYLGFAFAKYYWREAGRLGDPANAVPGSREKFRECREKAMQYLNQATNDWRETALSRWSRELMRMLPREDALPQDKK